MEPIRERIEDFIRRYWYEGNRVFRVLAVAVVLVAVGVAGASLLQTPKYEASAQMWVEQKQGGQLETEDHIGLQTIVLTLTHFIDSRPIAEEAIGRLGLRMEPAELLDGLTVEQVENTSFIVLTYEGTDPVQAKQIVNTVGEVSSERISGESAAGSKLRANVYEEAVVPESPVSPDPLRNGLLTLVIGLVLCAVYLVRMGQRGS